MVEPRALARLPRLSDLGASAGARSWRAALPPLAYAVLAVAVGVGVTLRLTGLDWDEGRHLHPDERYLSIVGNDVRGPSTVAEYFDVDGSPLSPYNVDSGRAYLYGQLPLFGTKLVATIVGRDDYAELYLVGRHLSALLDIGSVVLVFLIGRLLFAPAGRRAANLSALLAGALYALSVTAIQHAHFFTVESWLVFFGLLAFLLAAHAAERELSDRASYLLVLGLGVAVGAAISAKLSGGLLLLPVAVALGGRALARRDPLLSRVLRLAAECLVLAFGAYMAFRLTSPYAFAEPSWLNVHLNSNFRTALEEQDAAVAGEFLYPPAYQWLLSDRVVAPARNVLGWGLGPALGLTAVAGLAVLAVAAGRALVRRRRHLEGQQVAVVVALMLVAYVVISFFYFGSRFVHTLRYLVPVVPFLCLAAAAAILALGRYGVARPVVAGAVLAVTLAWAVAFTAVYRGPHTRVAASEWIHASLPSGSVIVNEHWDDGLPAGGSPEYEFRELPVFDADDAAKLRLLHERLTDADLYVLSSPRAWNTIGRLPDRFPLMTRFYELLRGERLGWRLAARFESKPELLGLSIDDLGAEEAFWVYDHPPVELYRPTRPLSFAEFERRLCGEERLPACS